MSKIFISHSRENNAQALAICDWLNQSGWNDHFLDIAPDNGISAGERWQEALQKAAYRCEAVIFLISTAWLESKWCLAEFLLAKELGKAIFGVIVENVAIESLPLELRSEWQVCNLIEGDQKQTFTVGQEPIVPSSVIEFSVYGLADLKNGLKKTSVDPNYFNWEPKDLVNASPYPGLEALTENDAAIFFGREADIIRGLDKIRSIRESEPDKFLVILGASGAGKSSYLKAGLWPRLKRDDHHFYPLPIIRPQKDVIDGQSGLVASLHAALPELNRADIKKRLSEEKGLLALLEEIKQRHVEGFIIQSVSPSIILCIDQAEELFSSEGRSQSNLFLSQIKTVLIEDEGKIPPLLIVISTIRSDTYENLQTSPELEEVGKTPFSLAPIPISEYKNIIDGPAKHASKLGVELTIDPKLTQKLIDPELNQGADALPILALVLERLHRDYSSDGVLSLDDYNDLFKNDHPIEKTINKALTKVGLPLDNPEHELIVKNLFIPALAKIEISNDEPLRQIANYDSLTKEQTKNKELIDELVKRRILSKDKTNLEIAHEALLRQWPKLKKWLKDEKENLYHLETIKSEAQAWEQNNKHDDWLVHTGVKLEKTYILEENINYQAELAKEPISTYLKKIRIKESEKEIKQKLDLLERERNINEKEKHQKITTRIIAITSIILCVTAYVVLSNYIKVYNNTNMVLTNDALDALKKHMSKNALKYIISATRPTPFSFIDNRSTATFSKVVYETRNLITFHPPLIPAIDSLKTAMISPDSKLIVTNTWEGLATVWDAINGSLIYTLQPEHNVSGVHFSPDSQLLLSFHRQDSIVRVIEAITGDVVMELHHENSVSMAQFSPDSQRIITTSEDYTTKVWDVSTCKVVLKLQHENSVSSVQFSRDSQRITTTNENSISKIWDIYSGTLLATLSHISSKWDRFSPDLDLILITPSDNTVKIRDIQTGTTLTTLNHENGVSSAKFNSNGEHLVTTSSNISTVWNIKTGKAVITLQGEAEIDFAIFSPDGEYIVTTSKNISTVWNIKTGKTVITLDNEADGYLAHFSPNGQYIITIAGNNAKVWDIHHGTSLTTLPHRDLVLSAQFSRNGQFILTASNFDTAKLWDLHNGMILADHSLEERDYVISAKFSPDGQYILIKYSDNTLKVRDIKTGNVILKLDTKDRWSISLFSPDGKYIVTTFSNQTTKLFNINDKTTLIKSRHRTKHWRTLFSPDGEFILTASSKETIKVWDTYTGQPLFNLEHEDEIISVVFSMDSQQIITTSMDLTVKVWDARTGKRKLTLQNENTVESAQFSPDSKRIVTSSSDDKARVWDAKTAKRILTLQHEYIDSAKYSPDGQYILTTSDNVAKVWDAESGDSLATLDYPNYEEVLFLRAQFSMGSQHIVTEAVNAPPRIWETHTGKIVATLSDENHHVHENIQFSPDRQRIITTAHNSIRIWDAQTGIFLANIVAKDVEFARISPDNQFIISASRDDSKVKVWDVSQTSPQVWENKLDIACSIYLYRGKQNLVSQDDLDASFLFADRHELGEDICKPLSWSEKLWDKFRRKIHSY